MPRIFMSYRRDDSRAISGRIYDRLVEAFGEENIFKDVDRIPPGSTFADVLETELSKCNVLLIIIGQKWVSIADKEGRRRLEDPHDFVRIEVEKGLDRPGMLVIPVLVDEAPVPSPIDLPDSLDKISSLQVVQIRHDPDFHRDMSRLIDFLKVLQERENAVQNREQFLARSYQKRILISISIVAALMLIGFMALVATGTIKIGQPGEAAFNPEGTANARLETLVASRTTPNATEQEAIVLGVMGTMNPQAVELELTSSAIAVSIPTIDMTAAAQSVQTEVALLSQSTQDAEATNTQLETQNAPTNTAQPTATPTLTSTPTPNEGATSTAQAELRANAQATVTAWTVQTEAAGAVATSNAQATQGAIVIPTATIIPYGAILFQNDFESEQLPAETFATRATIITENGNHALDLESTSTVDWGRTSFGLPNYTDYSFAARVKVITESRDGTDFGLQIRSDPGRGYGGGFDVNCCGGIGKFVNGVFSDLNLHTYALAQNTWYTLEIRAIGSEIEVYVNEQLVSKATDDTIASGYPFINLPPGVEIYVDDVKVMNLRQR
jgi:hypothetical protein